MKELDTLLRDIRSVADDRMPYYEFYINNVKGHYLAIINCYGDKSYARQQIPTYSLPGADRGAVRRFAETIIDDFINKRNLLPSDRPHLVEARREAKLILLC